MKGYKGFTKDLTCQGFKYELGKEYEHKGTVDLCRSGFHFCENPLDVLRYYQPGGSRYTEVEAEGVTEQTAEDSKRVASKLKIGAEVSLRALIGLGVKLSIERTKSATPPTGDSSHAATSGDYSPAATSGKESIAASIGREAKAKAALGSWIVVAEYKKDSREVSCVKTAKIDGKKLKPDTFYMVKKGKFVKCD